MTAEDKAREHIGGAVRSGAILSAAALRLTAIWPDKKVYAGELPKEADGNLHISVLGIKQDKGLGKRHFCCYSMQVLYFLQSGDPLAFGDWASAMLEGFCALEAQDEEGKTRIIRLKNRQAQPEGEGKVYRFLFQAEHSYVPKSGEPGTEGELMDSLSATEEII